MNTKTIILATSALALLAACSKSEVLPVESAPQEITFQTVETKDASSFSTDNKFYSYAYFLPSDKLGWAAKYASGTAYIYESLIQYVTDETAWRNASTHYYWPKQGQLTFFAWTDNTATPAIAGSSASVTCANNTGITFGNYSITDNLNKDLMVADITADQSTNTTQIGNWKKGVPTKFKHVLSDLVFTVMTDETKSKNDYPDEMFKLKSITLKNVNTLGDYAQGSPTASTAPWSGQSTPAELSAYSGKEITVTETKQTVAPETADYHIVLPQTFSDTTPVIEVVYTITTEYISGSPVTETVTVTKDLKSIYTESWASGKKYTLNIILGLEEILWDPSYEDWATGTGGEINI